MRAHHARLNRQAIRCYERGITGGGNPENSSRLSQEKGIALAAIDLVACAIKPGFVGWRMVWFFVTLVVLAIIFFAIVSEGFRAFLFVLILAGCAGGYWLYTQEQTAISKRESDTQLAKTKIRSSDLLMQGLRLSQSYSGSDSFSLTGLVTNNSQYQVKSLSLMVTVMNCDVKKSNCIVVGQDNSAYDLLDVPPSQARQLEAIVRFNNLPPLKNWQWNYQINYVEAE